MSMQTETNLCLNCGNKEHKGLLKRTEIDYDGREYEIIVCYHSRTNERKEQYKPHYWM